MNKNCFLNYDEDILSFYKVKNKSKIVVIGERLDEEDEKKYTHISYMYLNEKPDIKGSRSMSMVLSYIAPDFFTGMKGKKFIDIRHTVNQCSQKITAVPLQECRCWDVLHMIEDWRYRDDGGMKYGMREHAGIDKNIIKQICNNENKYLIDNTISYAFFEGHVCLGYACMSKITYDVDGINEFHYLTRKVSNKHHIRNLTEYVDWFMFSKLYETCKSEFIINWGCSDGGVLWYKMHKWPLYRVEPKWFASIYPNGKPNNKK